MFKKLLTLSLLAASCNTAEPIGSAVGSILLGAAAGGLTYVTLTNEAAQVVEIVREGRRLQQCQTHNIATPKNGAIIATIVSVGIGSLSWYLLNRHEPQESSIEPSSLPRQERYALAQRSIQKIEADSLISRSFASEVNLLAHATIRFGANWPLVLACNQYVTMAQDLYTTKKLLDQTPNDNTLYQTINNLIEIIEERVAIIIKTNEYRFQVELFERYK